MRLLTVLLLTSALFAASPVHAAVFPCTEQGILDAIALGGGPHTFDCAGPTTVITSAEIVIDGDVILDGEGRLTVDGNDAHRVFLLNTSVSAELQNLQVTNGSAAPGGGIRNRGQLVLKNVTLSNNKRGGGIVNGSRGDSDVCSAESCRTFVG